MRWICVVALALAVSACNGAQNAGDPSAAPPAGGGEVGDASGTGGLSVATSAPAPEYREVTLPAGTPLRLDLKSAIGSDTSRVEDTVRAELRQPVSIDGAVVLPAGTEIVGSVTTAEESGRVKGRARLAYRFTSLQYGGERYEISTAPLSHLAEATKGEDATKIGVGAGAGAAIGALLGGGDGAAKGAAIGGAAGTGAVLATRGKEVRLGPGADVNTRLTAPLTLRVRVS